MIVVVVFLLIFELSFAAKTRKKRGLGASFDWIDNQRGWVASIPTNLEACNTHRLSRIAFLNHLYLIPSSIRFLHY